MGLRALLLDLDGTLADTVPACVLAFQRAIELHGGPRLSAAQVRARFGPTETGVLESALPGAARGALATFLAEYAVELERGPGPFPGIPELLDELAARGVRLGLVTGKGPESTALTLERLGLAGRFEAVRTGSPRGLVKGQALAGLAREWDLDRDTAAYVGDFAVDVRAARDAGLLAVGAAWADGARGSELRAAGADVVFESVADLTGWARAACG